MENNDNRTVALPAGESKPWFGFYAQRWQRSVKVRRMSLEARGLYLELLCEQWIEGGPISADIEDWRPIYGHLCQDFDAAFAALCDCYAVASDADGNAVMHSPMLEEERARAASTSRARAAAGKAGAAARWAKKRGQDGNCHSTAMRSDGEGEGEGEGEREEKKKARKRALVHEPPLAAYGLDRVDVAAAWDEFRRVRSEKRLKPWADRTVRSKLKAFRGQPDRLLAALRHSADQEYAGLFEPKSGHTPQQPQRNSAEVLLERLEAEGGL